MIGEASAGPPPVPVAVVTRSCSCGERKKTFPANAGQGEALRCLDLAMADVLLEGPRPRIATSHVAQYIGRPVCFVGRVEKIHPSGKYFFLSDGDGKNATVELNEPLDEELSGVIEVVGRVTNQANIMCVSYTQFKEDKGMFDLPLYNEALKIIHEFSEYYPFGAEA